MASGPTSQITRLLRELRDGNTAAADQLWSTVYDRVHTIARAMLAREPAACTLRPTAMIGAAWERIAPADIEWADRGHFFAIATKVIRRILTEEARRRAALKRGGGRPPDELLNEPAAPDEDHLRVLAVAETLGHLEQINPLGARIVQLRYFEDLSIDETAGVLGVSSRSVDNGWRSARVWLHRELSKDNSTLCGRELRK